MLTKEQMKLIDDLEDAFGTLKPRLINKGPKDTNKLFKAFINQCNSALNNYNEELDDTPTKKQNDDNDIMGKLIRGY